MPADIHPLASSMSAPWIGLERATAPLARVSPCKALPADFARVVDVAVHAYVVVLPLMTTLHGPLF